MFVVLELMIINIISNKRSVNDLISGQINAPVTLITCYAIELPTKENPPVPWCLKCVAQELTNILQPPVCLFVFFCYGLVIGLSISVY